MLLLRNKETKIIEEKHNNLLNHYRLDVPVVNQFSIDTRMAACFEETVDGIMKIINTSNLSNTVGPD